MMQRIIWILWPAFLVAIPAVGVVFSMVDPEDMHVFGSPLEISRFGAYTVGFFFFWFMGACCSALTCLLQSSPYELNRCTLEPEDRPMGCPKQGCPSHGPAADAG